jgi:cellulose synthase/poly-beta-1,6-N-acetylglucosamine synthase-like glycosyltransferase
MIIWLCASLLLLMAYVMLLRYYRSGWNALKTFQANDNEPVIKISVVVAARNEAMRISSLLESLKALDYPAHLVEVIVVDDHSNDHTASIVEAYSFVRLLKAPEPDGHSTAFKKRALDKGIRAASGSLIVTTDADCVVPKNWLKTISQYYTSHHPEMVVMPVDFVEPVSRLDIFQSLDMLSLQTITGAAVYHHAHPMCNGANLAFTKQAFEKVQGYNGIDHIASGDDILLMQKFMQTFPDAVMYLKSTDVIVHTQTEKTVAAFLRQRIRWASKSFAYRAPFMYVSMGVVYFLNLILLCFPLAIFVYGSTLLYFPLWVLMLLVKAYVEIWTLKNAAAFFNRLPLLIYFLPAQPFHILYTVISGGWGLFKKYTWKDRTVR